MLDVLHKFSAGGEACGGQRTCLSVNMPSVGRGTPGHTLPTRQKAYRKAATKSTAPAAACLLRTFPVCWPTTCHALHAGLICRGLACWGGLDALNAASVR